MRTSVFVWYVCLACAVAAPAATDTASAAPRQVNIAVLELQAQSGVTQEEARVLTDELRGQLLKSGRFTVIERTQMAEILQEQGFQNSECASQKCAVEVGQLLGVRSMVAGTIGAVGRYLVLNVRLIDVGSGTIEANESVRVSGGADRMLEGGIADVVAKLCGGASAERARKKRRAVIISVSAAVVVAGGVVTAIILLGGDEATPEEATTTPDGPPPNTTVTF